MLRYAAFAVTMAIGGPGSLEHAVVGGGPLPGLHQTAYRAELQAMVRAIQICCQVAGTVRIWTDNQTVWRKTNRLLGGASVRPNAPHSDLLSDIQVFIAEHNLADRVTVHKVTSHCDTEFAFDDGEAWIFWHNKLVDAAADGFNARRPFAFWSKLEEVRTAVQFSRQLVLDIWEVIVHIGRLQSQCKLPTDDVAGSEEPQPVEVVEPIPEPLVEQRHYPQALIRMYGATH